MYLTLNPTVYKVLRANIVSINKKNIERCYNGHAAVAAGIRYSHVMSTYNTFITVKSLAKHNSGNNRNEYKQTTTSNTPHTKTVTSHTKT